MVLVVKFPAASRCVRNLTTDLENQFTPPILKSRLIPMSFKQLIYDVKKVNWYSQKFNRIQDEKGLLTSFVDPKSNFPADFRKKRDKIVWQILMTNQCPH